MNAIHQSVLSRREVLRSAAGVAGLSLLSVGCGLIGPSASASKPGTPGAGATPGAAFAYPTHSAFNGPKPDLAGGTDGLADAFFSYPGDPVKSVASPPGKGGDFTILTTVVGGGAPRPWTRTRRGSRSTKI